MSLYLGENLISGNKPINLGVRNIGEIVASSLPLTDAGLHLLDGSLILGGGIYQGFVEYIVDLYDNSAKYSNVTKVGSLTDNNGVLSGFSTSNYALTPLVVPTNTANTWEFCTKIYINSYPSSSSTIIGDSSWATGLAINVTNTGNLKLYIGNSGWNIVNGIDTSGIVSLNTWYYVRVTFDGAVYNLDISTDGENWTNNISVSSSAKANLSKTVFGAWNTSYVSSLIDINESYININGSRWWTGMQPSWATDEAQWQSSVTTYGSCGKFVYDSVNNTVRLPKVSDILQGTTDLSALGNLISAGLPSMTTSTAGGHNHNRGDMNITGAINTYQDNFVSNWGALYIQNTGTVTSGAHSNYNHTAQNIVFDASQNWTGNTSWNGDHSHTVNTGVRQASTVQPQTIKVLYYIVIANSTKTEIQVDIDQVATDLNGKADVDLTNCTDVANIKMAHNAMPSNTYVDLTLGASGAWYTAPADGFITFRKQASASGQYMQVTTGSGRQFWVQSSSANGLVAVAMPVSKGESYAVSYTLAGTSYQIFRFIYAVGSESEAS